ncbi:MAG TPA: hypothetical protein VG815_10695, partial [Chloroflexota bacterium]|nr:hypothetical protein [Chloroflexota bacterium]
GPRVIEQTTRERLPPGAAQAEFLLQHGMLDLVVPRSEMKNTLARLLKMYAAGAPWLGEAGSVDMTLRNRERDELRVGV